MRGRLQQNGESVSTENEKRFSLINEAFGGIKDILVLGRQYIFTNRFNLMSQKLAYSLGANQAYSQVPKFLIELITFSSLIALLLYLFIAHNGSISVILPIISVYVLATFKLIPAFQQIYVNIASIRGNIPAFNSIKTDLFNSSEIKMNSSQKVLNHIYIEEKLSCKDIYFTYPGKTEPALKKINICIKANSTVGIVGSSGSGKSTLINVLLGLLQPQKGEVRIDDKILNKSNLRDWQNTIGFVAQNILLNESITQNITMGITKDQVDLERVLKTIKLAHLTDLVNSLQQGLDTTVGENGA